LSNRVDLTLRARTQDDLDAALHALPPMWWELPAGVHAATWRVRRGVRRVRFFFVLLGIWLRINLALVLALAIALAFGAPTGMTFAAVLAGWALATFGFWRLWRRGVVAPSVLRRK
jgi:hypothetical protein